MGYWLLKRLRYSNYNQNPKGYKSNAQGTAISEVTHLVLRQINYKNI